MNVTSSNNLAIPGQIPQINLLTPGQIPQNQLRPTKTVPRTPAASASQQRAAGTTSTPFVNAHAKHLSTSYPSHHRR